jgi:PAS domain S-box-containing protein
MTKTSARIVTLISSHRPHTYLCLLLLMLTPVLIFDWAIKEQITRTLVSHLVVLIVVYALLALALIAFVSWLYAQAERGSRFINLSIDGFCIAGEDGYFKYLNPSWSHLLGFTRAELMSRPYLEFVHPEDRAVTLAEGREPHGSEATFIFQNRLVCRNGSYKWLAWNASRVPGEQVIYAVARDVTEIKEASQLIERQQLQLEPVPAQQEATDTQKKILDRLSQDLRTPLHAIVGFSWLLADGLGGELNAKQAHYVGHIKNGANHLLNVVNQVLDQPTEKPILAATAKDLAEEQLKQARPPGPVLLRRRERKAPGAGGACVLLVDDDEGTLRLLESTVQKAGYRTCTAANGKHALEILNTTVVDAVLMDLVMPEIDGFELIRQVKRQAHLNDIPLFVLTSRHLSRDESVFLARETQGFFQKDRFWGPDLLAALHRHMPENRPAAIAEHA